jgi:hypothetical protein
MIGGDPPRPTARDGGQPDIAVGDERDEVAVNMGEAKVPG